MLDNRAGLICEECSSHIFKYIENDVLIIECSYCGSNSESYDDPIKVGDLFGKENDL